MDVVRSMEGKRSASDVGVDDVPASSKARRNGDFVDIRAEQKEKVLQFLASSTNGFIHLCGMPGTGKTMMVRSILDGIDYAKTSYVNCVGFQQPFLILDHLEELKFFTDNDSIQQARRKKKVERLIIVMDEIDYLRYDTDDGADTLSKIVRATTHPDLPWTIIAISNTLDQRWKAYLQGCDTSLLRPDICFPPYNLEQLRTIIEYLYGHRFHPAAIKSISAHVAANGMGDARTAIVLCQMALSNHSPSEQVTFQTAQRIASEVFRAPTNKTVSGLPLGMKTVLAICLYLNKISRAGAIKSSDVLVPYNNFIRRHLFKQAVSQSGMAFELDMVQSTGLIRINPRGHKKITVLVSLDEFDEGLTKEERILFRPLMKARFDDDE